MCEQVVPAKSSPWLLHAQGFVVIVSYINWVRLSQYLLCNCNLLFAIIRWFPWILHDFSSQYIPISVDFQRRLGRYLLHKVAEMRSLGGWPKDFGQPSCKPSFEPWQAVASVPRAWKLQPASVNKLDSRRVGRPASFSTFNMILNCRDAGRWKAKSYRPSQSNPTQHHDHIGHSSNPAFLGDLSTIFIHFYSFCTQRGSAQQAFRTFLKVERVASFFGDAKPARETGHKGRVREKILVTLMLMS